MYHRFVRSRRTWTARTTLAQPASAHPNDREPLLSAVTRIPEPPIDLIQQVVLLSAGPRRAPIQSAVAQVEHLRQRRGEASTITAQVPEQGDYRDDVRTCEALGRRGFGSLKLDDCRTLLTSLDFLHETTECAMVSGQAIMRELQLEGEVTWQRLPLLHKLLQFIRNPDHKGLLDPRLLRGTSRTAVRQAFVIHKELIGERDRLLQVLVLDDCPGDDELKVLRQTLRTRPFAIWAVIGIGPLATARRRVRRFVRSEKILPKHAFAEVIDRVIYWRGKVALFAQDRSHATEIPGFAGIETRWQAVLASLALMTEMSEAFGLDGVRRCCDTIVRGTISASAMDEAESRCGALLDPTVRERPGWAIIAADPAPTPMARTVTALATAIAEVRQVTVIYGRLSGMALASASIADLATAFATVTSLQMSATALNTQHELTEWLGPAWSGEATDCRPIRVSLEWADQILKVDHALGPAGSWLLVQDSPSRCAALKAFAAMATPALEQAQQVIARLTRWGKGVTGGPFALDSCAMAFDEVMSTWTAALATREHVVGWSRWCVHAEHGAPLGLNPLLAAGECGDVAPAGLMAALDADVYGRVAQVCISGLGNLRTFERAAFDTTRADFRRHDRALLAYGRSIIEQKLCAVEVPRGVAGAKVADLTEMRLIEHEVNKQRAHVPVRRLLDRAWLSVTGLTPCLMMSPLSVAQLLPRTRGLFDLVVMDEASQIRPEDAFGALLRGKQAVIVGDTKQMPPSRLFDAGMGGTDAGDDALAGSSLSILELAETSFGHGRARLKWHYRSQHESLIQFSNAKYYDDELVIFPSHRMQGPSLGIQRVYLPEGKFQGGVNIIEAEAVAQAVIDHALTVAGRSAKERESLLVVTMNREQCDRVTDLIESRGRSDETVRNALRLLEDLDEPLMIKNLENVQGDERDRVIIGCTYGKDPKSGRVFQRFGPITQAGGERRLNVLFSRAKKSITVFTSLQSGDILDSPGKGRGPRDLKDYLQFVETGAIPERGILTRREPDSPFERSVGGVIAAMGMVPAYQVGVAGYFIDIGVVDPHCGGHYVIGVECDGATYHSSRCARDRDRLRQDILEHRGWTIHRIWSTAWFRDRTSEVKRLQDAIETARKRRA
jgi:hypothetical protein